MILVLIKHSLPEINPQLPAAAWPLSAAGRGRASTFTRQLTEWELDFIASSVEPKARETAKILAEKLGIDWQVYPGLHEHERPAANFTSQEEFAASVAAFFASPDALVFGAETATQAFNRFNQAVGAVCQQHAGKRLAIVAHGTVISLFIGHYLGLDPFSLWGRLSLPSLVVVEWPEMDDLISMASFYPAHIEMPNPKKMMEDLKQKGLL